ncbi:SLAM family member 5-like [Mustelus asterias]
MMSKFFHDVPPWKVYILLTLGLQGLGQCEANRVLVNGTLGKAVRLTPSSPMRPDVEITWWKQKVVICQRASITGCNPEFGNRITLDVNDVTMEIKSLQSADAGLYQIKAGKDSDIENQEEFELRLYDAVSQPMVSMNNLTINGTCRVTLSCWAQKGTDVHYTWKQAGNSLVAKVNGDTRTVHTRTLELTITSTLAVNYSCTARNPVSQLTTAISLQNICRFTSPEEESVVDRPVLELMYILILVVTIFLLILIVTLLVLFFIRSKKIPEQIAELPDQSISVYAEVSIPSQVSRAARAAPSPQSNTVYSMVTSPRYL